MSESADQWANDTLKWHNKDNSVEAEWINLIAHRFDETTDDRFTNMLFSTKECNTNLMRAEAAITQLLFSGRTYAVKIETEVRHALKHVRMLDVLDLYSSSAEVTWLKPKRNEPEVYPHPDWLAPEFKCTITSFLPAKEGYVEESSSTVFHPFSRQRPFRYEYELDKILLEMYLDLFEVPIDVDPIQAFKAVVRKGESLQDAYYLDGVVNLTGGEIPKEAGKETTKSREGKVPGGGEKDSAGSKPGQSGEDGKESKVIKSVTKQGVMAMSKRKDGKPLWPGPEHVPTRHSTL
ncbi:hypothetical protein FRC08_015241 [Ceratobasidium sp. 394]|nr:hypothetical protein FRC08_015241 [Ceratobasidium sp. 394]